MNDAKSRCPICRESYTRPAMLTACLHVFDLTCLLQAIELNQNVKTCPLCNTAMALILYDFDPINHTCSVLDINDIANEGTKLRTRSPVTYDQTSAQVFEEMQKQYSVHTNLKLTQMKSLLVEQPGYLSPRQRYRKVIYSESLFPVDCLTLDAMRMLDQQSLLPSLLVLSEGFIWRELQFLLDKQEVSAEVGALARLLCDQGVFSLGTALSLRSLFSSPGCAHWVLLFLRELAHFFFIVLRTPQLAINTFDSTQRYFNLTHPALPPGTEAGVVQVQSAGDALDTLYEAHTAGDEIEDFAPFVRQAEGVELADSSSVIFEATMQPVMSIPRPVRLFYAVPLPHLTQVRTVNKLKLVGLNPDEAILIGDEAGRDDSRMVLPHLTVDTLAAPQHSTHPTDSETDSLETECAAHAQPVWGIPAPILSQLENAVQMRTGQVSQHRLVPLQVVEEDAFGGVKRSLDELDESALDEQLKEMRVDDSDSDECIIVDPKSVPTWAGDRSPQPQPNIARGDPRPVEITLDSDSEDERNDETRGTVPASAPEMLLDEVATGNLQSFPSFQNRQDTIPHDPT
ncbi:hypothetical protein BLNAU_15648 [Blattamonas nauphoetae]|uniref:RING-type domain-containing protein n=1 Tax=Blattamonas nauphoetae TaxID=2049346 RepID=A0ABQ9XFP3_9EUKA|nr:hypothetical protein BLNAU_15648 [Blattamonas nauphoetae]